MENKESKKPAVVNQNELLNQKLKIGYSSELMKKNNLDADLGFHATELMKQIFVNQAEYYDMNIFNYKGELNFDIITYENIPLKTITPQEYAVFPEYMKNEKKIIPRALSQNIILILMMLFGLIISIITLSIDPSKCKVPVIFLIASALGFAWFFSKTKSSMESMIISLNSQVGVGNVIWFDSEKVRSGDYYIDKYYVDVAFYDEKKFVRKIECDEKQFRKLQLDSKVIIYKSKAYGL